MKKDQLGARKERGQRGVRRKGGEDRPRAMWKRFPQLLQEAIPLSTVGRHQEQTGTSPPSMWVLPGGREGDALGTSAGSICGIICSRHGTVGEDHDRG